MRAIKKPFKKREGWYRHRSYSHFDTPISRKSAEAIVTNPVEIVSHRFWPFVRRVDKTKRYKKDSETGGRKISIKYRPIEFASHVDSHIFSYYADLLTLTYEKRLEDEECASCIIAYRSLGKTNVHFAAEAFEETRESAPCAVLAFDVKGFFNNLDHDLVKDEWRSVVGVDRLPEDHYAVFRAITKYSFVKERRLKKLFAKHYQDRKTQRRRRDREGRLLPVPRICTPRQFRERVQRQGDPRRTLVAVNKSGKGIPQGSPISALLANLYMLPFDRALHEYITSIGGSYRRYSDDLLIVCPIDKSVEVEAKVNEQIERGRKLKLGPDKTERFAAYRTGETLAITKLGKDGVTASEEAAVQYLGFEFDGSHTRLRSSSLTRYYRRMARAVKREKKRVEKAKRDGKDAQFSTRRLYRSYSHVGATNFPRYAYRAARIMGSPAIQRQLRRHAHTLRCLLEEHEDSFQARQDRNKAHRTRDKERAAEKEARREADASLKEKKKAAEVASNDSP